MFTLAIDFLRFMGPRWETLLYQRSVAKGRAPGRDVNERWLYSAWEEVHVPAGYDSSDAPAGIIAAEVALLSYESGNFTSLEQCAGVGHPRRNPVASAKLVRSLLGVWAKPIPDDAPKAASASAKHVESRNRT